MHDFIVIDSLSHPGAALFARLTEAQLRNRLEPEKGIFIAESPKVIRVALQAGLAPVALLAEERHLRGDARDIVERCGDIPIYTGNNDLLRDLTGFELTRGVLCAMRRPVLPPAEAVCAGCHRIVVTDNVVNSTNTGAIFRAATALGIEALLLTPTCCDPLNRRAVRVSMGTVFQLPWTYLGDIHTDWPGRGIDRLHDMGFKVAAMALSDVAVPVDDPQLMREERLAILLGTEGDGLSAETLRLCDYVVRIPMQRGVDSLNVAAASAVAFWQLRYQG